MEYVLDDVLMKERKESRITARLLPRARKTAACRFRQREGGVGSVFCLFLLSWRRMWQGQVDSRRSLELRGEARAVDKDLKASCIRTKCWDRVTLGKVDIWETERVQTKDRFVSGKS